MLRDQDRLPDVVHTSLQQRAIRSAELALGACDRLWIPVRRSWRLNERHYGALQGKDKKQTAEEYGAGAGEAVATVLRDATARRSTSMTPPIPASTRGTRPYRPTRSPSSECLADVVARMLPYWYDGIVPDLVAGRVVLVAAHGNSLRALIKHLDGLSEEAVVELNVPTGQPLVYELDERLDVTSRGYLDPTAAAAAAELVARQAG